MNDGGDDTIGDATLPVDTDLDRYFVGAPGPYVVYVGVQSADERAAVKAYLQQEFGV